MVFSIRSLICATSWLLNHVVPRGSKRNSFVADYPRYVRSCWKTVYFGRCSEDCVALVSCRPGAALLAGMKEARQQAHNYRGSFSFGDGDTDHRRGDPASERARTLPRTGRHG